MSVTLVLPWFPIILAVGVAGRLLGRTHGFGVGLICAFFWLLLGQASIGSSIWLDPWAILTIFAGMCSIVVMGGWAAESPVELPAPRGNSGTPDSHATLVRQEEETRGLTEISLAIEQFDDWLEEHQNCNNPWPDFGEFIRSVLCKCCSATHVTPYHVARAGNELIPMREPDPFSPEKHLSARKGIVGHVATTGRSYVAGDPVQGELLENLAEEWETPLAWCFAIREGPRKIGVVLVGHLDISPETNRPLLRATERLISLVWRTLREANNCRAAKLDDPVSGVHSREAFLRRAELSVAESYKQGEPVALAIVAMEKLRKINDSGHWEVADELIKAVGSILRRKIRIGDELGRFDGSRFILLLRRVDSELASLIVAQIMAQLETLCGDTQRWPVSVGIRCGVVGSGTDEPDLRTLVVGALQQCKTARLESTLIASDVQHLSSVAEATT